MLDPQDATAYVIRGAAWFSRGDYDRAFADFDQAVRVAPNNAGVYNDRGKAYYDRGDRERAIADFDRAIDIDPQFRDAHINRGNALRDGGERDRADADFKMARRLDPYEPDDAGDAATCEHKRGPVRVAACDRIVTGNPNDAVAFNNRGNAYADNGDVDRAIADYDQAIRLDPELAAAWYSRGVAWSAKHDKVRTESDSEQAMKLGFGSGISGREARTVNTSKCSTMSGYGGIAGCTNLILHDPKNASAYTIRGAAWSGMGEHGRAIADYEAALKLDPNDAEAREGRARAQAALAARPEPGPAE
jgi:tetratricopeptide (TPR) repeat protein